MNYAEFLLYMVLYQCIFSLDIIISFSEALVLITLILVFYTIGGHHSNK